MKSLGTLCLSVAVLLFGAGAAESESDGYSSKADAIAIGDPSRAVQLLSAKASRALKISPIPTAEPIPLIVGSTWRCHVAPGDFEVCEPVLVVCTNDQSFCTTTP